MEFETVFWIVIVVAFIAISTVISFGIPSDGVATDSIARIADAGLIWKTWRVQLTNDHPIEGTPMQYGVENDTALLAQLQTYAGTGQRVKLSYHGKLYVFAWEASDTEIIYKVEPA